MKENNCASKIKVKKKKKKVESKRDSPVFK